MSQKFDSTDILFDDPSVLFDQPVAHEITEVLFGQDPTRLVVFFGTASISGAATMQTVAGPPHRQGVGSISGGGTLSVDWSTAFEKIITISGGGSIFSEGVAARRGEVYISARANISGSGFIVPTGFISGGGTISGVGASRPGRARLSGKGWMYAIGITGLWWHSAYVYRRVISLESPVDVDAGHPVTVVLDPVLVSNGKVRQDLEDVEVVFAEGVIHHQLYREVDIDDAGHIHVSFQLQEGMEANKQLIDKYYVYYGNPTLYDSPVRPEGDILEWPISVESTAPILTYTRPGEHWLGGTSTQQGARASALFYGSKMRIISNVGPDQAIMEVQINGKDWFEVDLYASDPDVVSVFEFDDLYLDSINELRVRVSGRRRPTSFGDRVNIARFEYSKPVHVDDLGEQVNRSLTWSGSQATGD